MNISLPQISSKFELHYFFNDNSHTMDAVIRNKCEKELLNIFKQVSYIFDIPINIESEAIKEGGVKERWNLFGRNAKQITAISTLIIAITGVVSLFSASERNDLKKTDLNLSIQNRQLENKILKAKFSKIDISSVNIEEMKDYIVIANNDIKIIKYKSNYYSNLENCDKVTQINFKALDNKNKKIGDERIVKKEDFHKFILKTDDLPSEKDNEAIIEIVSPVLKKRNFKWKGIYQEEPISFDMKDVNFKNSVIQGYTFKNGTFIKCVLEKSRKLDESGEIEISGYAVSRVIEISNDIETIKTPQGKKYIHKKEFKDKQMELF